MRDEKKGRKKQASRLLSSGRVCTCLFLHIIFFSNRNLIDRKFLFVSLFAQTAALVPQQPVAGMETKSAENELGTGIILYIPHLPACVSVAVVESFFSLHEERGVNSECSDLP